MTVKYYFPVASAPTNPMVHRNHSFGPIKSGSHLMIGLASRLWYSTDDGATWTYDSNVSINEGHTFMFQGAPASHVWNSYYFLNGVPGTARTLESTTDEQCSYVALRSNNELVSIASGLPASSMGTPYNQVVYKRRTAANTFTAPVLLSNNETVTFDDHSVFAGSNDRVHFFWRNATANTWHWRTLSATNTLSATETVTVSAIDSSSIAEVMGGVSLNDGTTLFKKNNTISRISNSDTPTITDEVSWWDSAIWLMHTAYFALDAATGKVYAVMYGIKSGEEQLRYAERATDGTWGTPVYIRNNVTAARGAIVYTKADGAKVLGYVASAYDATNGTWHYAYGEVVLVAAPVTVAGESTSSAATMLDGTASSTVTDITVSGEAFASTAIMTDGSAAAAAPVRVVGESFASTAVGLDGTAAILTPPIAVAGQAFTTSAAMADGSRIITPPVIVAGQAFTSLTGAFDGFADLGPMPGLSVLDKTLTRAPTSATVVFTGGIASTEVIFDIDGTEVYRATTDSDGELSPTSIPIPEPLGAGTHTVTATQVGARASSDTFTLARDPSPYPIVRGPDAQAVDVPGAVSVNGSRDWVLQDLMPGGLGSYILPVSPSTMTSPHVERLLQAAHTTSRTGRFHVNEGGPAPVEWQFSGYCPTQAMLDKLVAYGELNRRFYVIDHRGRAWKVTFVNVDASPRLRHTYNGVASDWGHDYTVSALVFDQQWVTPA